MQIEADSSLHATRLSQSRLDTARRIVRQFGGGAPDWADAPMVIDAAIYTDPARHAREREALFRRTPLVACLSSDIAEPGQFRRFDAAGVPMLIMRGRDGALRAFLNICAHRAAPLVQEQEGTAARFTCLFHAWTYSAEGKLIGVPQREGFAGCLDGRDLTHVPAAEAGGLVFVQATPGGATLDLDAHLGPFAPELAMLNLSGAEKLTSTVLTPAANWKFVLDTYGEGYHFASLHRETIAPYFRADVQVYTRYGRHHKITWAAKPMADWTGLSEADWRADQSIGWVHYIFPNTIIFAGSVQLGRPYFTLYQLLPGENVGQTTTLMTTYLPDGADAAERAEIAAVHDATVHILNAEDYMMAEAAWQNLLHAPPGHTLVFGRQEIALQMIHRDIAAALGETADATSAP